MIKLFVADVDGTLLNDRSEFETETAEAIRRFQSQGGTFMVATGRDPWELSDILSKVDGVVINCVNGALLCEDSGKVLFADQIGEEYVRYAYKLGQEYSIPVQLHSEKRSYFGMDKPSFKKRAIANFGKYFADPEDIFQGIYDDDHISYGVSLDLIPTDKIGKIEIMFMMDEELKLLDDIVNKEFNGCNIAKVRSMASYEITSMEADKGLAISRYCELKGIKEDETAVAGDGGNDIGMLKRFRNSYAMANADEATKKAASFITYSNAEKGIARLLNEISDDNVRYL